MGSVRGQRGTVGCAVRPRPGVGRVGRVDAVFDRSLLLRLGDDFVVVGDLSIAPHPYAVTWPGVLPRPPVGTPALVTGERIEIPRHVRLELSELETFTPRRCTEPMAGADRIGRALELARAHVRAHGPRAGLQPLLADPAEDEDAVLRAARGESGRVQAALRAADGDALVDACGRLAGLGGGLTPSGDDYAAGVVAALRYHDESAGRPPPEPLLRRVAAAVAARTSAYSGFLVRCAARGLVSRPVADWLHAIVGGDEAAVPEATDAVARVGHSSGVDALAGLVHALQLTVEVPAWTR